MLIGEDVTPLSTPRYRHEIKYVIDRFQMTLLDRRLSAVMQSDRHAREDGTYDIRSLYFDNAQDKALKEKGYSGGSGLSKGTAVTSGLLDEYRELAKTNTYCVTIMYLTSMNGNK